MITKITSASNPKLRYIQKLKDKKFREEEKRIFVEGFREIQRALSSIDSKIPHKKIFPKFEPEILCISPEWFLGNQEWNLIQNFQKNGGKIWEFSKPLFEKISYRDRPDGLIAISKLPSCNWDYHFLQALPPHNNLILIIEGVEKPGNLGTIIRTANGAGVSMVIVTDGKTDIFSPNVIRASTGILFHIPIFQGSTTKVLMDLKQFGYKLIALSPDASLVYTKANLTGNIGLVFGSEQYGLSNEARSLVDDSIRIPMLGEADSLNLAQSCGIVMYEALRQKEALL